MKVKNLKQTMIHRLDIEILLSTLNRYTPVRHRTLMTRRNKLRLRFLVLPLVGLLFAAVTGMTAFSPALPVHGAAVVQLATADDAAGPSIFERLKLTQQRLQRSLTALRDSQPAEKLALLNPAAGSGNREAEDSKAPVPAPKPPPAQKTVKIGAGDTLSGALNRAGLSSGEAYQVVAAVRKRVDPKDLKPGQTLKIKFDPTRPDPDSSAGFQLASLKMAIDPLHTVSVARGAEKDQDFQVEMREKPLEKHIYAREATIENSLFGSALKAGIPAAVISEAIHIYSWNVDFQRDIREGDKIQVMYEQYETKDGVKAKTGNLIYASLVTGGNAMPIYRYEQKNGDIDYFQPNGHSIRKTLMKTPIDGARISSGFGMRKHPILGYSRMHKGIDFAAPKGTPIYAAGDGTVQRAGRVHGYGNYVRLRHNSRLSTAYGHMSRIAVHKGEHVKQGEIIGYVGMTGMATGPHLHYEILVNNVQVNPRGHNLRLPIGKILQGKALEAFKAHKYKIDRELNDAMQNMQVASNAAGQ